MPVPVPGSREPGEGGARGRRSQGREPGATPAGLAWLA